MGYTPPSTASKFSQPMTVVTAKPKRRIGDVLLELGYVNDEQLRRALSESRATASPIGATLVRLGIITEEQLGRGLAHLHGYDYVTLSNLALDPTLLKLIPVEFCQRNQVLPLSYDATSRRMLVVMAHPDDIKVLDDLTLITGCRITPKVSTHTELMKKLEELTNRASSSDEALEALANNSDMHAMYGGASTNQQLEDEVSSNDAPVVQLVNALLIEAIQINASDIHIEPQKERLLVRFRIDGILREVKSIPKQMIAPVTSRIKVASGMDIAEKRRPQDGRMKIAYGSQQIDMRVNALPIQFGEKIVIRLLKPNATTGGLEKLGLTQDEVRKLRKMIYAPHGIILVTGPTGSGKTTTLYSALREINSPERNISTIEDPIEYPLAGINQTQVAPKSGLTFVTSLRALLRQDPDVIMVGEIRDHETLEAAIHASLTGHLVFSTVHTNSTAKTVARLLEMGAPAYLLSTSVIGVVAQRLVRSICPHCKTHYTPSHDELETLGFKTSDGIVLYKGTGCDHCEDTGYRGRVGLYEIMPISREIAVKIDESASAFSIEETAIEQGMLTLAMDGKRKVLAGLTTLEEVTRVLGLNL